MTRALAAALAASLLTGCYTIRWERRSALPEEGTPRVVPHHAFVGGTFIGSAPLDLQAMCPAGLAAVEQGTSGSDWFWQTLTTLVPFPVLATAVWAPIWEPTTVKVTCARPGLAARSGHPLKAALLPLSPLGGVSKETAQLLGDALAGELRKRPGVSVLTQSDISALLGVEKTRQMMGCADSGCMAEIGGALGVDRVVHGSIGRVGGSLVVNLSALDARHASSAASVSERLRGGDEEAFLDVLPTVADALLADAPPSGGPR
jgi:hypothetical protein